MSPGWSQRLPAAGAAVVLGLGSWSVQAAPRLGPMPSCVSDAVIQPAPTDAQTLLDPADRVQVGMAILAQYPMLLRGGFTPSQIMLWQRHDGEVLYVSLQPHPKKPGALCFTAAFAAETFDLTASLLQKYFFASVQRI
jgi:hypothetical protein